MFILENNFSIFQDGNYVPQGILVEDCYELWHKHGRPLDNGYALSVGGNRFFIDAPQANRFELHAKISFTYVLDYAAASVIVGYQLHGHNGYEICLEFFEKENSCRLTLIQIKDERLTTLKTYTLQNVTYPKESAMLHVRSTDEGVFVAINEGEEVRLDVSLEKGLVGFQRPDTIGENAYIGEFVLQHTQLILPYEPIPVQPPVTVEIPMLNGGTMPFYVTYELLDVAEKRFLKATLDGGAQDRTKYPYFRAEHTTGQYAVEHAYLTDAYVKCNDKKIKLREGTFDVADSGLHWKGLLDVYMGVVSLPFSVCVAVEKTAVQTYAFGYENLYVSGFATQSGKAEFAYTAKGKYIGEVHAADTAEWHSPKDKKAVQSIPKTVYEYDKVKAHFENNHYFAQGEEISFVLEVHSNKPYLHFSAQLQDVYGDKICDLQLDENRRVTHAPLPVGLYRIYADVYYGDTVLTTVDTVFEVYDETGEKCAPLESGLPFTFSTPNEQQYLDRDVFDPWSPVRSCNLEHYTSCCAWTGDIGERKRVWEVIKLFGRSWYVWLESHRTMEDFYYEDHLDIVKNADYIYYPSDYEWAVLRSDYLTAYYWTLMPKMRALLDKFLDERDGAREVVGYERDGVVSYPVINNLYLHYQKEWYDYANAARLQNFAEQNEMLGKYNPNWKRACYGPYPVYGASMRSYKLIETMGSPYDDRLSDTVFTGFCQYEDYPHSCAYQTYRGAFGAGTIILHAPKLRLYPEQYTGGGGGCTDGHVKFANPPFGKRVFPKHFHTTHAREYVYNTACKTEEGYRYWSSYGFMKRDIPAAEHEQFVKDWKYVLQHKPQKQKKGMLMVAEFPDADNVYDMQFVPNHGQHFFYNRSEEGVAYAYQISREFGLPCGAFSKWETLLTITAEDVDVLVLPSLQGVSADVLQKIRNLHEQGVRLIATSRVDGLEDLFGVRYSPTEVTIRTLEAEGKVENCYPFLDTALYASAGAKVVMTASEVPAIFVNGNTALVNIPVCSMGRTYFRQSANLGRITNSELLKETFGALLCNFSSPLAKAEQDVGITLFEDENGNDMLLVVDYSNYDSARQESVEEKYVQLNVNTYASAKCVDKKPLRQLQEAGTLRGLTVGLKPHESALIRLIKK